MRVISFKLWGDFAHFRRHYTTSSPLTHSIPPPSTIRGIVAAILGLEREKYPENLSPENSRIGVRLLKPIKKIRFAINYMDTKEGGWVQLDFKRLRPVIKKDGHGNPRLHTRVRMEFVKDPVYEIFFYHEDTALFREFADRLKAHKSVYTPYLGISECIANFEFLWEKEIEPREGFLNIISAIRIEDLNEFNFRSTNNIGIIKEVVPLFINSERIRTESVEVLLNPYANPISADIKEAWGYPGQDGVAFAFIG